jgi:hypothetical protein
MNRSRAATAAVEGGANGRESVLFLTDNPLLANARL